MPGIPAIIWHALRRRCVVCGRGHVMHGWLTAATACPDCGFHYERSEHGYQVGSYTVNICLTLVTVTLGIVAAVALTWPDTNWTMVTIAGAILAAVMPIAIFPWSKSLFLAIDAILRPPAAHDFERPAA
jgi:uncharacterized protein (DUF983 family)